MRAVQRVRLDLRRASGSEQARLAGGVAHLRPGTLVVLQVDSRVDLPTVWRLRDFGPDLSYEIEGRNLEDCSSWVTALVEADRGVLA